MHGWQANKKRTCAQPVSYRAMPENEIPPAMRGDFYYAAGLWKLSTGRFGHGKTNIDGKRKTCIGEQSHLADDGGSESGEALQIL